MVHFEWGTTPINYILWLDSFFILIFLSETLNKRQGKIVAHRCFTEKLYWRFPDNSWKDICEGKKYCASDFFLEIIWKFLEQLFHRTVLHECAAEIQFYHAQTKSRIRTIVFQSGIWTCWFAQIICSILYWSTGWISRKFHRIAPLTYRHLLHTNWVI